MASHLRRAQRRQRRRRWAALHGHHPPLRRTQVRKIQWLMRGVAAGGAAYTSLNTVSASPLCARCGEPSGRRRRVCGASSRRPSLRMLRSRQPPPPAALARHYVNQHGGGCLGRIAARCIAARRFKLRRRTSSQFLRRARAAAPGHPNREDRQVLTGAEHFPKQRCARSERAGRLLSTVV